MNTKKNTYTRKGWVIRIVDGRGNLHFPIPARDINTKFDIDRQDAYYNDIVPFIMVYGTKDIAKSYVPYVRKAAEEKARSCYLTKPSLPLKVEVVRYNLTIG